MLMLGIETSCDETGVALVRDGRYVLANEVASQIARHAPFGGVVPEIASREHTRCIMQLAERALAASDGAPLDAVAATCGPGLMGSLLVGVNFARSLAWALNVPYVPVHHIEGHIYSVFIDDGSGRIPEFPFLALVVSGGHTCLIKCPRPHHYKILGSTRDDAVGECFDKVARLLGLPYPGGPSVQRAAEGGNPNAFRFPRALAGNDSIEFSYSGLKTAVLYALRDNARPEQGGEAWLADMAASFQHAAIDVLVSKTRLALRQTGLKRLVLAGGVAANQLLRKRLAEEIHADVFLPAMSLCIDNGAMIAAAACSRLALGVKPPLAKEAARASLALG